MINRILGAFSTDMGIDLGTCNTLVCIKGRGIVISEPSVVAVKKGTSEVLLNGEAVGTRAKEMLGKTHGSIEAIRPLKDGVISNFEITQSMLRYFIRKVHQRRWGVKPQLVIAVPSGITTVEKNAVIESAMRAGSRKVYLVTEPMAAAIGSGLAVQDPVASMIVDIGGGTTEVAVISLGGIVVSKSIRCAGDSMDKAIIEHMRRTYNLLIGQLTAERIKIQIGSAISMERELTMEVKGLDSVAGLPRRAMVSSEEVREALREPVQLIIEAVMDTLEKTMVVPELATDLVDRGFTMAGGGSLLRGLPAMLSRETGLPVRLAEDPLSCVARGTSIFLDELDLFSKVLDNSDDQG